MDEEEFHQWMVFDLIEPIGDVRFDMLFTMLRRCWISNVAPEDLIPRWGSFLDAHLPAKPVSLSDLKAMLARAGGKPANPSPAKIPHAEQAG